MFDEDVDADYKEGLEELEQNLLLEQLNEIIEAFESKASSTKDNITENQRTLDPQSFHKANPVLGEQTKQKRRLDTSGVQMQKSLQADEGVGASEAYRVRRRRSDEEEFPESEWDYLLNPRWYFGDKEPRKWDDDKILRARLLLSDYRNLVVNDYIPLEAEYELYDILNELYEDEDPEENW